MSWDTRERMETIKGNRKKISFRLQSDLLSVPRIYLYYEPIIEKLNWKKV